MNPSYRLLLPVALLLAGCGSLQKPPPVGSSLKQSAVLSSAQKKVVSAGVREMVAKVTANGGESAKPGNFTAFRRGTLGGTHVCGNVSYQVEPGKPAITAPFYLELEQLNGSPAAKRGQVGFDKLKRSKVLFMCRHVNGP